MESVLPAAHGHTELSKALILVGRKMIKTHFKVAFCLSFLFSRPGRRIDVMSCKSLITR